MGTKFAPEVYDTDILTMAFPTIHNTSRRLPVAVGFMRPLGLTQIAFLGAMGAAKESQKKTYQKYPPVIKHGNGNTMYR